jgi:hypothetical protein
MTAFYREQEIKAMHCPRAHPSPEMGPIRAPRGERPARRKDEWRILDTSSIHEWAGARLSTSLPRVYSRRDGIRGRLVVGLVLLFWERNLLRRWRVRWDTSPKTNSDSSFIKSEFSSQRFMVTEVTATADEYYFRYRGHTFSILRRRYNRVGDRQEYQFFVYPRHDTLPLSNVAKSGAGGGITASDYVLYSSKQAASSGEIELFANLYAMAQAKWLNIDKVFKDILGG